MYYVSCWYDWDGICSPPDGKFAIFETYEEARKTFIESITNHCDEMSTRFNEEYNIKTDIPEVYNGRTIDIRCDMFSDYDYSVFILGKIIPSKFYPIVDWF